MLLKNDYFTKIQDRFHAAVLLAERLHAYRNSNAVIVAIPCGGVPVGYYLARILKSSA